MPVPDEEFSEKALEVLRRMLGEAVRHGYGRATTDHLLIALIRSAGVPARILEVNDINPVEVVHVLEQRNAHSKGSVTGPKPTTKVERVKEYAREESRAFAHSKITTGALLLAILREGDSTAAEVLQNFGLNAVKVRAAMRLINPRDG